MATEKRLIDANKYPCRNCGKTYCYQNCKEFIEWLENPVDAVVMPCKIGQTVYEVVYLRNGTVSHVSPLKVVGIHIGDFPDLRGHKRKSYLVVVYPTSEILGRIPLDKVGKTLFMTKKEAEAALAKMDGDGNG